ncbi:lipoate--protein ligase family protein [Primorskyibacter sp. S187A]|uniref:lipoate--protein ligase family protein n=1 Tax=Primorskyibacter sp. S187A TaxID=3415130 RepID=UPI003C7A875B
MIETVDAGEAFAREAAYLDDVSRNPEKRHLWIWQSPQCLVAPRNLAVLPEFETVSAEMAELGWPVHVRATGGDVTPQGPGIINVTHVYGRAPGGPVNIAEEYGRLCAPIETALGPGSSVGWQPGAFCDGAYNVQYQGLKFAGTAMRFRPCRADKTRYAILSHALMLFAPPTQGAIDALNLFLDRMGQGRVIELGAHTGLPEDCTEHGFLQRLHAAFLAG